MTAAAPAPVAPARREIGRVDRGAPGPTVLVMAGVHGNEPAGVHAALRVLAALDARAVPVRGRVVALAGNLPALAEGRRFLARDLNRGWGAAALAALRERPAAARSPEDGQQAELLERFEDALRTAKLQYEKQLRIKANNDIVNGK